jgi:hypothetical protein
MGIRSAARAAWADMRKSNSLAPLASTYGYQQAVPGTGQFGAQPPSDATIQAMAEQGMQAAGAFSPGQPIYQFFPQGSEPREWDFQTGYNVAARPRSQGGRPSFQTLNSILGAYDVARLCIEHVEDDLRSLEFSIVPSEETEDDVSADVKTAVAFMEKPDGITPFDSWQQKFLEDVLRFDAGCLYKRRNRGGKVIALEVLSGQMIAPLIDFQGRPAAPPAPAFLQYIQGMPGIWLNRDDLIYNPFRPYPESMYGMPPIEWLLLNANTDLRFQWHFLQWFTEGSLPEAFMEAPPDESDPENLKRFQRTWDAAMEGDQAQKHKIRWIPNGSKPTVLTAKDFNPDFPLYLMRKTTAAYKVTPNDIGFTDSVNKASADTQVDVQFRVGTLPRVRYLEGIYTRFLRDDLGLRVKFQFNVGGEKEDRLQEAQAHDVYVKMGAESPDEVREKILGLPVDTEHPTPRFIFSARAGAIPIKSIEEIAGVIDPTTAGPEGGSVDPNNPQGYVAPTGVIPQADDAKNKGQVAAAAEAPAPPPPPPAQAATAATAEAQGATAPTGEAAAGTSVQKAAEVRRELARWRDNARKRVKAGRAPRPFESAVIPEALAGEVWADLRKARSSQEVDETFATFSGGDLGERMRLSVAQRLQDEIAAELASREN